jgi:hypothetical protein
MGKGGMTVVAAEPGLAALEALAEADAAKGGSAL